jgi:hypothetical protein
LPLVGFELSTLNYFIICTFAFAGTPIRLDSSTMFAICWTVRALVELGAPQAIRGIRQWAEQKFGHHQQSFEWCNYAEMLASAR